MNPSKKKKEWENIYELWVGISNIFFFNLPNHKNECGDGEGVQVLLETFQGKETSVSRHPTSQQPRICPWWQHISSLNDFKSL